MYATAVRLTIVLISAIRSTSGCYIDVAQRSRPTIGDAHEELAVRLVAGVDVRHGEVSSELAVAARFASAWLAAALALEELVVGVVAAIGVIEANIDLTTNLIFEDTGVQVETGGNGLRLTWAQVERDTKVALLAGSLLAGVDILAVVAADNVHMHVVHIARPMIGDAHEKLAVGLIAGVDVGHCHIGGKTARGRCCNGTDRDDDDRQKGEYFVGNSSVLGHFLSPV